MSNLDDELNFNDISGRKETTPPKQKTRSVTRDPNKTGTTILVPVKNNTWVDKDLSDVTGIEFAEWAYEVYPISLKEEAKKYNSLAARVHKFKEIMQYHMYSPFQMGRNNKPNPTIN